MSNPIEKNKRNRKKNSKNRIRNSWRKYSKAKRIEQEAKRIERMERERIKEIEIEEPEKRLKKQKKK